MGQKTSHPEILLAHNEVYRVPFFGMGFVAFQLGVVKLALSYWALKPLNLAHPAQVDRPARPGWLGKWLATARVKAQLIDF